MKALFYSIIEHNDEFVHISFVLWVFYWPIQQKQIKHLKYAKCFINFATSVSQSVEKCWVNMKH